MYDYEELIKAHADYNLTHADMIPLSTIHFILGNQLQAKLVFKLLNFMQENGAKENEQTRK